MNFEDLEPEIQEKLIEKLSQHVTPSRWEQMEAVISERTKHITVALEDIYQPHNAAAVLRSCDGFGIQDVHIIENRNEFNLRNRQITKGADKWLNLNRYNNPDKTNTETCIGELKSKGYRVVTADLRPESVPIEQLSIEEPVAILIGTEMAGVSKTATKLADGSVNIPMYGFTQSFNLSVCAAIILHTLTDRLRCSEIGWKLTRADRNNQLYKWMTLCIQHYEAIVKDFFNKI